MGIKRNKKYEAKYEKRMKENKLKRDMKIYSNKYQSRVNWKEHIIWKNGGTGGESRRHVKLFHCKLMKF